MPAPLAVVLAKAATAAKAVSPMAKLGGAVQQLTGLEKVTGGLSKIVGEEKLNSAIGKATMNAGTKRPQNVMAQPNVQAPRNLGEPFKPSWHPTFVRLMTDHNLNLMGFGGGKKSNP